MLKNPSATETFILNSLSKSHVKNSLWISSSAVHTKTINYWHTIEMMSKPKRKREKNENYMFALWVNQTKFHTIGEVGIVIEFPSTMCTSKERIKFHRKTPRLELNSFSLKKKNFIFIRTQLSFFVSRSIFLLQTGNGSEPTAHNIKTVSIFLLKLFFAENIYFGCITN